MEFCVAESSPRFSLDFQGKAKDQHQNKPISLELCRRAGMFPDAIKILLPEKIC